jgi:hypothetical protein
MEADTQGAHVQGSVAGPVERGGAERRRSIVERHPSGRYARSLTSPKKPKLTAKHLRSTLPASTMPQVISTYSDGTMTGGATGLLWQKIE